MYRTGLHSPLISFDLDDTLICYHPATPREPVRVPWPLRPWFREPLRFGTADLMLELISEGWQIAVYTTSRRSPTLVGWFLRFHGVRDAHYAKPGTGKCLANSAIWPRIRAASARSSGACSTAALA